MTHVNILDMKTGLSEMKNTPNRINGIIGTAEEKVRELNIATETIQN